MQNRQLKNIDNSIKYRFLDGRIKLNEFLKDLIIDLLLKNKLKVGLNNKVNN